MPALTIAGRRVTHCDTCNALIFFAISTTTGRRIPLDANPVDNGNVTVDNDGKATIHGTPTRPQTGHLFPVDNDQPNDDPRYVSHHSTCPDATSWRDRYRPAGAAR